ncbi:EF-hand domain-containing family member C2 [Fopius arisanus]|uniref:EF-hand domain-containing family member C2 n=1 Tax=Fopius arisanus TaxID=64838 RepID=A0A9R1T8K4_9HYME|nr:PREDICTED: EF-hand domain-containing family member C2 [Fopius arisanus]
MEKMRRAVVCLPGFNFDDKIGRTNFHRPQHFEKIHDGVYYLAEKPIVEKNSRYPSNYSYIDEPRIPPWIAYDGQRLMFQGFFQETVEERWKSSHQIRLVTISFFLEDGTMKIVEPAISNSGLEQGVLVRRQRIPIPDRVPYRFYDILDLNIGKEPEIFGRVYKIVNCDKFTKIFLNRMGIPVPDPIDLPSDPYIERRSVPTFAKKPNRKIDTLGKFLTYDRKVLRFYGYWDDRESEYGIIHDLEVRYYLADDTIEIKEILPKNSGREGSSMYIKRMKIPKFFSGIESVGSSDPFTVLNVLGDSGAQSYFIPDALNAGETKKDYYKDSDLIIGTSMNVFGREVVITDLDPTTREYYRGKYGIEEFKPLEKPESASKCFINEKPKPPPYNGFGSYDDSLGNCFSVIPKPPRMDYARFAAFDKQGYDSKILSFRGKMLSNIPENSSRNFIIRVYLMDNTVSIFEFATKNGGFTRSLFQKRMEVPLPGQEFYSSVKPQYFEPHDFYIGADLNLGGFNFHLTSADDYTLRYMELNCDKFSRANAAMIISKMREGLKPSYKHFLEEFRPVMETDGIFVLPYEKLRESLMIYLKGRGIVEHEIITIARRYAFRRNEQHDTREYLRRLIHTELTRFLWNNLDRLAEDINHWDPSSTGFLPSTSIYTILRGCRLPLDPQLINCLLNHLRRNPEGEIDCHDLLDFMNVKINSSPPVVPVAISTLPWWNSDKDGGDCCPGINWNELIKDLDIKEDDPASANSL